MTFAATDEATTFFWSTGYAWGTMTQKPGKSGTRVELKVLHGKVELKTLELTGAGTFELPRVRTLIAGKTLECKV